MHEQSTIVIEPNAVIRESLQRLLVEGGFAVSGAFDSVAALQEAGCQPKNVTVILSSLRGTDVDAEVKRIKALLSSAAIVVLGGRYDLRAALEAIRSGANACLHDAATSDAFFRSLKVASHDLIVIALSGKPEWEGSLAAAAGPPSQEPAEPMPVARPESMPVARPESMARMERNVARSFSPRETAILQLLKNGEPNKSIARKLGLTESTVKVYLKSILRKIGVNNRTQAAIWAMASDGIRNSDDSMPKELNGSH